MEDPEEENVTNLVENNPKPIFDSVDVLNYDDIELFTFCKIDRAQLIALYLRRGDLILYQLHCHNPKLKVISWYKEPVHKPVALTFNATGSFLLLCSSSCNLYLIPALVILDESFQNDLPLSSTDITIYTYPFQAEQTYISSVNTMSKLYEISRKVYEVDACCVGWWQSIEDGQQCCVVATKSGMLYFVDLLTGEKICEKLIENEEITHIDICWDKHLNCCVLLILTKEKEQYKLTLEDKPYAYLSFFKEKIETYENEQKRDLSQALKDTTTKTFSRFKAKFHAQGENKSKPVEKWNIVEKTYLNKAPKNLGKLAPNTIFGPQCTKSGNCIGAFNSFTEIFCLHSIQLEDINSPKHHYRLTANADDILMAEPVIYYVTKDRKQIVVLDEEMTRVDSVDFNTDSIIDTWNANADEHILAIKKARETTQTTNDWPEGWKIDIVEKLLKDTPQHFIGPILVFTTRRVLLFQLTDIPVRLILKLIMEDYGLVLAEKLCKLFGLKIKTVLLAAGDIQLKLSKFSPALGCYKLAQCNPVRIASKLAEYGLITELSNFGISLLSSNNSLLSINDQIYISNLLLMGFINQLLKNNSKSFQKRLMNFLETNEFYDRNLAVIQCGHSLLFNILHKLILRRGLIVGAFEVISKLIENFKQDPYLFTAAKGYDLWMCISDENLQDAFLINKNNFISYSEFITKNVSEVDLKILNRYCKLLDPRSISLRTLMRLIPSTDCDVNDYPLKELVQVFLIVFLVKLNEEGTWGFNSNLVLPFNDDNEKMEKSFANTEDNSELVDSDAIWPIRKDIHDDSQRGVSAIKIKPLSCGFGHVGLIRNGSLYTWGNSNRGCLGRGAIPGVRPLAPDPIGYFSHFRLCVSQVACGRNHTLALTNNGVYSWGSSQYGQLGLNETLESPHPRHVSSLIGEHVVSVSCGQYHSLFLTASGCLLACGWNTHGQLGLGTIANVYLPQHVHLLKEHILVDMAAGYGHSIVLTATGNVYAFGSNAFGQLGVGKDVVKSTKPILIREISGRVTDIATGYFINLALTTLQNVFTWGQSPHVLRMHAQANKKSRGCYQMFTYDCEQHILPFLLNLEELKGSKICQIVSGCHHSALVTEEGFVFVWGRSSDGLGIDDHTEKLIPTRIPHLEVHHISLGCDFTVAQDKSSGKIYGWGSNSCGQLGLPVKDSPTSSKSMLDGKMLIVKATKKLLRIPNYANSYDKPVEVPNIPSATFTYQPLNVSLDTLGECKLSYTPVDWHLILQRYFPVLNADFLLCKCLNLGNHQAAAKLLLLQNQIKPSLIHQLKALPFMKIDKTTAKEELLEDLKTPDSEIHLFTIQGGKEAMCHLDNESEPVLLEEEKKADEYTSLVTSILLKYLDYVPDRANEVLACGIEFWIEQKLPMNLLEDFFEKYLDRIYYDLGVILYCGSKNICKYFSTKFTLTVTGRILQHVECNNGSCPEFLSVLSSYLVSGENTIAQTHSVIDIYAKLFEPAARKGGVLLNWPGSVENPNPDCVYVFSCGHSSTHPPLPPECSSTLVDIYQRLNTDGRVDVACPECLFKVFPNTQRVV